MSTFLLHSQFFYLSHTELHWGTGVTHSPQLLSFCLLQPGFSVGNTSPSGKSNVPVSCPPLAAVQISALLWLSIACKGSSALVPRVPLSFLPSSLALVFTPLFHTLFFTLLFCLSAGFAFSLTHCSRGTTTISASRLCLALQPHPARALSQTPLHSVFSSSFISLSSLLYLSTFPSSVFASYLFSLPYSSPSVFSFSPALPTLIL